MALGSNVGDRRAHLEYAYERLATFIGELRLSRIHETQPVGVTAQPVFLNAVAVGVTPEPAGALLCRLQDIERERGRRRPSVPPGGPRTLDLDLILAGSEMVETPVLTLPHPRFRTRRFVLDPLAELAPGLVDPVSGLTVQQLLDRL